MTSSRLYSLNLQRLVQETLEPSNRYLDPGFGQSQTLQLLQVHVVGRGALQEAEQHQQPHVFGFRRTASVCPAPNR